MESDRERAFQMCQMTHHEWIEEYYGYHCTQCGEFIPYGCEPWMPDEDERYPQREYDDEE